MRGSARRLSRAMLLALALAGAAAAAPTAAHARGGAGIQNSGSAAVLAPPLNSVVITIRVYQFLLARLYQQIVLASLPLNPLASDLHTGDPGAFTQVPGGSRTAQEASQAAKGPPMSAAGAVYGNMREKEDASADDEPSPEDENSIVLLPLDEIKRRARARERWVSREQLATFTSSYSF